MMIILFTLHTILNAIICCLQLNTSGMFGRYFWRWIISHRCSWITVYVYCCNAQSSLIVIMSPYVMLVLYQLPSCNLFTQHVIICMEKMPLVICGPRSFFYTEIQSIAIT